MQNKCCKKREKPRVLGKLFALNPCNDAQTYDDKKQSHHPICNHLFGNKMNNATLALLLGGGALAVSIVALVKPPSTVTTTTSFSFSSNLVPTENDAFAVGSSLKGVAGVWLGGQPDLLTVSSDRLMLDGSSYTTFQDLGSYTTLQALANASYTSQQFIANQSFTSQQFISNQSFSTAFRAFNPSYGGFYSTENQYMGQVTSNAGLSSKSSLFYNYATAHSDDVICSVSKPSTGGTSVSGDSRIFVLTSGVYKIGTSIQMDQTANSVTPVGFWLAVDGTAVPDTGSVVTIQQSQGETFPYVEFIQTLSASQYIEIKWNSFNTTSWVARFVSNDGIGSLSDTNVPSVITNVYRIA